MAQRRAPVAERRYDLAMFGTEELLALDDLATTVAALDRLTAKHKEKRRW